MSVTDIIIVLALGPAGMIACGVALKSLIDQAKQSRPVVRRRIANRVNRALRTAQQSQAQQEGH